MAENGQANGADGPTKGHNIADLKKLIRNCAQEVVGIKTERQGLNERMGDIRKRLKDSGVQPKAFDFAVRVLELEAEARAEYLDNLSINFEALGIGGQADMFLVKDEAGDEAEHDPESKHFKAGKGVAMAGGDRDAHDYEPESEDALAWQAGWDAGKGERDATAAAA